MKKSQVTIFIIIAVIAALLLSLVIYSTGGFTNNLRPEAKNTENFIKMCYDETAECMLHRLGDSSGNLEFKETMPEFNAITENSISYFNSAVMKCFNGFEEARKLGQKVEVKSISPQIEFNNNVILAVKNDILITELDKVTEAKDYSAGIDLEYTKMYDSAVNLKASPKPEGIGEEYILLDSPYDVDVADKNGIKIFSLSGGLLRKQPFRFNFVK